MDFMQILREKIILDENVFVKSKLGDSSIFTIHLNTVEAFAKNDNIKKSMRQII